MEYKHYSFDVWGTLIKRNPEYRVRKIQYLQDYIHKVYDKGVAAEIVSSTLEEVWRYFDTISQMFGKAPNPLEMYALVIFRLTNRLDKITPLNMELIYKDLEVIFLEYPPSIYSDETRPVLEELKQRGKTLSILSNTSYTRGSTINLVLQSLGIRDLFDFCIYSDEVGFSKPSHHVFSLLDSLCRRNVEDVMHVGDNHLADGAGASEYGFGHFIINSTSFTIKDLL